MYPCQNATLFAVLLLALTGLADFCFADPNVSSTPALTRTDAEARVITLRIPAPRGKILDEDSKVLVDRKLFYQVFIRLPWDPVLPSDVNIRQALTYVEVHSGWAQKILKKPLAFSMDDLKSHLDNRRWLPFSLGWYLDDKAFNEFKVHAERAASEGAAWILQPVYFRHYPHKTSAAHILGTVGKIAPLPKGPLVTAHTVSEDKLDPLFEDLEGKSGIEKAFDKRLRGIDGVVEIYVDRHGIETGRSILRKPQTGEDVRISLRLDWQQRAEKLLVKSGKSGAFVFLDLKQHDIKVLASNPSYNLEDFVPFISEEKFKNLNSLASKPLLPRAWAGFYPPGSVFKVVTSLAALEHRVFDLPWGTETMPHLQNLVKERTALPCDPTYRVGNKEFVNWNRYSEGMLSLYESMMRSCNTWFYPVGLSLGGDNLLKTAQRLGLGQTVGLEAMGEKALSLPFKKRYFPADVANMSIGQGDLLVSPLQVARMVAALLTHGISQQFTLSHLNAASPKRTPQNAELKPLHPQMTEVLKGSMYLVVNGRGALAKAAVHPFSYVSGKTGTAQWGPKKKKTSVVWFAGFFPYYKPRYAFAVMLEGKSYQEQSGGETAAPLLGEFLRQVVKKDDLGEAADVFEPPVEEGWVPRVENTDLSLLDESPADRIESPDLLKNEPLRPDLIIEPRVKDKPIAPTKEPTMSPPQDSETNQKIEPQRKVPTKEPDRLAPLPKKPKKRVTPIPELD